MPRALALLGSRHCYGGACLLLLYSLLIGSLISVRSVRAPTPEPALASPHGSSLEPSHDPKDRVIDNLLRRTGADFVSPPSSCPLTNLSTQSQADQLQSSMLNNSSALAWLEGLQFYLEPAPLGIDARYSWEQDGGRGQYVRVFDIELDWNERHPEFAQANVTRSPNPAEDFYNGCNPNDPNYSPACPLQKMNHGTSALGVLVADPNNLGVTGIVHLSPVTLINALTQESARDPNNSRYDIAQAIHSAAAAAVPGDVILLELQVPCEQIPEMYNPPCPPSPCDPSLERFVPVEYTPNIFDEIYNATSLGVIVVEAAGNGCQNLDGAAFRDNPLIPAGRADSGAIIVGAGVPPSDLVPDCPPGLGPARSRLSTSSYGSRVDLQGWGYCVVTTGGGGDAGLDPNGYTNLWSGTSSAAAVVAGAAAAISSYAKETTGSAMAPRDVRRLLVATGTPQYVQFPLLGQKIGPQPDLQCALGNFPVGADWRKSGLEDCSGPPGWQQPVFDDSSWLELAPPEVDGIPEGFSRYYRGTFALSSTTGVRLFVQADDGAEIFINGVALQTYGSPCYLDKCLNLPHLCANNHNLKPIPVPAGILNIGPNLIAVHVWNAVYDLSYFDVTVLQGDLSDSDVDGFVDGCDNCPTDYNPGQEDTDLDGHGDLCDCAPEDPSAFAVPLGVFGFDIVGDYITTLLWNSLAPTTGNGIVYQLVRGVLSELPIGSGASEQCVAGSTTFLTYDDWEQPADGEGYWYLVRGRNVCGTGTYGTTSDGSGRSTSSCP